MCESFCPAQTDGKLKTDPSNFVRPVNSETGKNVLCTGHLAVHRLLHVIRRDSRGRVRENELPLHARPPSFTIYLTAAYVIFFPSLIEQTHVSVQCIRMIANERGSA